MNQLDRLIGVIKIGKLIIIALTLLLIGGNAFIALGEPDSPIELASDDVKLDNILKHIYFLSSIGSRYPGYPGCEKAANYIYNYLANELGLNTFTLSYRALIPYDQNSTLTILRPIRKTFRVYALSPNMVELCRTPPGGVEGELIYVGKSDIESLKDIGGKIVLIDYNSGANWLYLKNLGAKAVIFVEPEDTTIFEEECKIMDIPVNFPRVIVKRKDAKSLLSLLEKERVFVKLNVDVFWKEVELRNIFSIIPGTCSDLENIVMIAAHYDAYSAVPALTPAADSASGVATLLEFARVLKKNRPLRTVIIAAFSGSAIGMAGARYFSEQIFYRHWEKPLVINGNRGRVSLKGTDIRLIFVLDLSSESSFMALFAQGAFYGWFDWARVGGLEPLLSYFKKIGSYDDRKWIYELYGRKYRLYIPAIFFGERKVIPYTIVSRLPVIHMGEVFNHAGVLALTFYTVNRFCQGTIADTRDKVNPRNLKPQTELVYQLIYTLLNDPDTHVDNMLKSLLHFPSRTAPRGFALLRGRVWYFDEPSLTLRSDWNQVLDKDDIIVVYVRMISPEEGYRHCFISRANATGFFEIPGLKPSGWALGAYPYEIAVFVIDNRTGQIKWATDQGSLGKSLWPHGTTFTLSSMEEASGMKAVNLVLFKCGVLTLHGCMFDPESLLPLKPEEVKFIVLETTTQKVLEQYGVCTSRLHRTLSLIPFRGSYVFLCQDAVFFLPPDIKVDIVLADVRTNVIIGILRNKRVGLGEYRSIKLCQLEFAKNILEVSRRMLENIRDQPTLAGPLDLAEGYYDSALREYKKGVKSKDALRTFTLMFKSLYIARKTLSVLKETYSNIATSTLLLLLLLIPTTLVLEKLLFGYSGPKRIASVLSMYILLLAVLAYIHPGFRVLANPFALLSGMLTIISASLPIVFLLAESYSIIREVRRRILGPHFIDISRVSITSSVMDVSVRNLRKRPLRTALTIATITLMVLSLILFTSWKFSDITVLREVYTGRSYYKGILIRARFAEITKEGTLRITELSPFLPAYLKGHLGSTAGVCPRVWLLYPTQVYSIRTRKLINVGAVVGVAPDEPLPLSEILVDGNWFRSEDEYTAILSDKVSAALQVKVGDEIYLGRVKLIVTGIVSSRAFLELRDMDGFLITPVIVTTGGIIQEEEWFIFIPYKLAFRMGGLIYTIAIYANDTDLLDEAKCFSEQLSQFSMTHYSNGVRKYIVICIRGHRLMGIEFILIPFLLAFLALSNTMIGSLYEKRKEIGIYASLGLAPTHAVIMTFSEGLAYSLIGSILGYIVACTISFTVQLMGLSLPIDIASPYLPMVLVFSIVVSGLASIYPSLETFKQVTPSLRRRWKIPTKPRGNEWYIALPFTSTSLEESLGFLEYLSEYFENVVTKDFKVDSRPIMEVRREKEKCTAVLSLVVRLPPYDAAISELVKVISAPSRDGRITLGVRSELKTGKRHLWISGHRGFIDHIRKQLLMWKGLKREEKALYIRRGLRHLRERHAT